MKKKIVYKNFIQKKYLKSNSKILNKDFQNNLNNIIDELENVENTFHSLSKKFKMNFKNKDIYNYLIKWRQENRAQKNSASLLVEFFCK